MAGLGGAIGAAACGAVADSAGDSAADASAGSSIGRAIAEIASDAYAPPSANASGSDKQALAVSSITDTAAKAVTSAINDVLEQIRKQANSESPSGPAEETSGSSEPQQRYDTRGGAHPNQIGKLLSNLREAVGSGPREHSGEPAQLAIIDTSHLEKRTVKGPDGSECTLYYASREDKINNKPALQESTASAERPDGAKVERTVLSDVRENPPVELVRRVQVLDLSGNTETVLEENPGKPEAATYKLTQKANNQEVTCEVTQNGCTVKYSGTGNSFQSVEINGVKQPPDAARESLISGNILFSALKESIPKPLVEQSELLKLKQNDIALDDIPSGKLVFQNKQYQVRDGQVFDGDRKLGRVDDRGHIRIDGPPPVVLNEKSGQSYLFEGFDNKDAGDKALSLRSADVEHKLTAELRNPQGEVTHTIKGGYLFDNKGNLIGQVNEHGFLTASDPKETKWTQLQSKFEGYILSGEVDGKPRNCKLIPDAPNGDINLINPQTRKQEHYIVYMGMLVAPDGKQVGSVSMPRVNGLQEIQGGEIIFGTDPGHKRPIASFKGATFNLVSGGPNPLELTGAVTDKQPYMPDGRLNPAAIVNLAGLQKNLDGDVKSTTEIPAERPHGRVSSNRLAEIQQNKAQVEHEKQLQIILNEVKSGNTSRLSELAELTTESRHQRQIEHASLAEKAIDLKHRLDSLQNSLEQVPTDPRKISGQVSYLQPGAGANRATANVRDGQVFAADNQRIGELVNRDGVLMISVTNKEHKQNLIKLSELPGVEAKLTFTDENKPRHVTWVGANGELRSIGQLKEQVKLERELYRQTHNETTVIPHGRSHVVVRNWDEFDRKTKAANDVLDRIQLNGVKPDLLTFVDASKLSEFFRPELLKERAGDKNVITAHPLNTVEDAIETEGKYKDIDSGQVYQIHQGKLYAAHKGLRGTEVDKKPAGELGPGYIVTMYGTENTKAQAFSLQAKRCLLELKYGDGATQRLIGMGRPANDFEGNYQNNGLVPVEELQRKATEYTQKTALEIQNYRSNANIINQGLEETANFDKALSAKLSNVQTDRLLMDGSVNKLFKFEPGDSTNKYDQTVRNVQGLMNDMGVQTAETQMDAAAYEQTRKAVSEAITSACITVATLGTGELISGSEALLAAWRINSVGRVMLQGGSAMLLGGELSTDLRSTENTDPSKLLLQGALEGLANVSPMFFKDLGPLASLNETKAIIAAKKAGQLLEPEQIAVANSLYGKLVEAGASDGDVYALMALHETGTLGSQSLFNAAAQAVATDRPIDPGSIAFSTASMALFNGLTPDLSFLKMPEVEKLVASTIPAYTQSVSESFIGDVSRQQQEQRERLAEIFGVRPNQISDKLLNSPDYVKAMSTAMDQSTMAALTAGVIHVGHTAISHGVKGAFVKSWGNAPDSWVPKAPPEAMIASNSAQTEFGSVNPPPGRPPALELSPPVPQSIVPHSEAQEPHIVQADKPLPVDEKKVVFATELSKLASQNPLNQTLERIMASPELLAQIEPLGVKTIGDGENVSFKAGSDAVVISAATSPDVLVLRTRAVTKLVHDNIIPISEPISLESGVQAYTAPKVRHLNEAELLHIETIKSSIAGVLKRDLGVEALLDLHPNNLGVHLDRKSNRERFVIMDPERDNFDMNSVPEQGRFSIAIETTKGMNMGKFSVPTPEQILQGQRFGDPLPGLEPPRTPDIEAAINLLKSPSAQAHHIAELYEGGFMNPKALIMAAREYGSPGQTNEIPSDLRTTIRNDWIKRIGERYSRTGDADAHPTVSELPPAHASDSLHEADKGPFEQLTKPVSIRLAFELVTGLIGYTSMEAQNSLGRATKDFTGLNNSRATGAEIERLQATTRRNPDSTFDAIVFSVDQFKGINDNKSWGGHEVGDVLLKGVGEYLSKDARISDFKSHLAGDTYAMLVKSRDSEGAQSFLRSVDISIRKLTYTDGSQENVITIGKPGDPNNYVSIRTDGGKVNPNDKQFASAESLYETKLVNGSARIEPSKTAGEIVRDAKNNLKERIGRATSDKPYSFEENYFPFSPKSELLTVLTNAAVTLEEWSTIDKLTGLPNKLGTHEEFERSLAKADRDGEDLTYVKLDFVGIGTAGNCVMGEAATDKLIRVWAEKVRSQIRPEDIVGRTGGDELDALIRGNSLRVPEELARLRIAATPPTWEMRFLTDSERPKEGELLFSLAVASALREPSKSEIPYSKQRAEIDSRTDQRVSAEKERKLEEGLRALRGEVLYADRNGDPDIMNADQYIARYVRSGSSDGAHPDSGKPVEAMAPPPTDYYKALHFYEQQSRGLPGYVDYQMAREFGGQQLGNDFHFVTPDEIPTVRPGFWPFSGPSINIGGKNVEISPQQAEQLELDKMLVKPGTKIEQQGFFRQWHLKVPGELNEVIEEHQAQAYLERQERLKRMTVYDLADGTHTDISELQARDLQSTRPNIGDNPEERKYTRKEGDPIYLTDRKSLEDKFPGLSDARLMTHLTPAGTESKRIVDLGAGRGSLLDTISRTGASRKGFGTTGIDMNQQGPGVIQGDARQVNELVGRYSSVLSTFSVLSDSTASKSTREDVMTEVLRGIENGGSIVVGPVVESTVQEYIDLARRLGVNLSVIEKFLSNNQAEIPGAIVSFRVHKPPVSDGYSGENQFETSANALGRRPGASDAPREGTLSEHKPKAQNPWEYHVEENFPAPQGPGIKYQWSSNRDGTGRWQAFQDGSIIWISKRCTYEETNGNVAKLKGQNITW